MGKMRTQLGLDGSTCIERAIRRIREFEPVEPYIVCNSGGKDSTVLVDLADQAGVAYEAHYHVTTIDPPPVIRFLRRNHPATIFDKPEHGKSFAQRVGEKGFPLRRTRWCCSEFKEREFPGRRLLMGCRRAERRTAGPTTLVRHCQKTGATAINPILDWSDGEVWGYIKSRELPYCRLYDEGYKRIGCICCPFASGDEIKKNRARWPAMFRAIRRGFHRRWEEYYMIKKPDDIPTRFKSADDLFEWWLMRGISLPGKGTFWQRKKENGEN